MTQFATSCARDFSENALKEIAHHAALICDLATSDNITPAESGKV